MGEAHASAAFPALGTTAIGAVDREDALAEAELLLRRELDAVDAACSRFREDSELSEVNRRAGEMVHVGPYLLRAIEVALDAAEASGGSVDPTVGRALGELGYDRDFVLIAGRAGPGAPRLRPAPGWRGVRVDRERSCIRVPRGTSLDLGATAKAMAADRAAERIGAATGAGTMVALGGDIALAGAAPAGGWAIRVTDDHRLIEGRGETVAISAGGLATSSTTVRRWSAGRIERHHLVDPATGDAADAPWRTVSVAAPTCVDANVASTAAIVRGRTAAEWLGARGLPARLVGHDGEVLRLNGWPEPAR
jgi:thiamine biosynthesis lipoprotein